MGRMEILVHLATRDEIMTCGYSGATSIECKTVMTTVLMVKSGGLFFLISGILDGWFGSQGGWALVRLVAGVRPW